MHIFENNKAFATALLIQGFDIYGMDLFEYDENVLSDDLKKRFPETNNTIINRLFAGIGLYSSNLFFQDPVVFGQTCRAFNRHKYLQASEPSLKDICWGVAEAYLITAPEADKDVDTFSEAIKKYVGFELKYNGIITNVPSLPFMKIEEENTGLYDPVIDAAALENSVNTVNSLENYVQTNMIQCLNQISQLPIQMADEAKTQLSNILRSA
jgi:hypothetical protein